MPRYGRSGRYRRILRAGVRRVGYFNVTRNCQPLYIAPGTALGTPLTQGNTGSWTFGSAVASGGLVAGLYDVPWTKYFNLSDVIQASDFTALFDLYRINSATLTFRITSMSTTGAPGAGGAVASDNLLSCPTICWFPDLDDNQVITPSDIRERMGVRMKQLLPGRAVTCKVSPRTDGVLQTGATFIGAALGKRKQWVDCNNSGIAHYGFKGMIKEMDLRPTTGSVPTWQISCEIKLNMSFRNAR